MSKIVNIAILASGGGSNAEKIMAHFKNSSIATVVLVMTNKKEAGVLNLAAQFKVPTYVVSKEGFQDESFFINYLRDKKIDLIVLAGFLWKVPSYLVDAYPDKIINIHPALLPDFGGKGMYGHFVHEAVIQSGAKQSGITIHLVDHQYDHGKHLTQVECPVTPDDTAEQLAAKVLQLEHLHFSTTIQDYIMDNPGLFK